MTISLFKPCIISLADKIKFLLEKKTTSNDNLNVLKDHTNVRKNLDLASRIELALTSDFVHIMFGSLIKSPLINSKCRVKFLFPIVSYCSSVLSKTVNKYQVFNNLQAENLSTFVKTFLIDEDIFGGAYGKEKLQGFSLCLQVSKIDKNILVAYKNIIKYFSRSVFLSDNYLSSDWKYISFIFRYIDWGGYNKSLDYSYKKEIPWDEFKDLIKSGNPIFWHKLTKLPLLKSSLILSPFPEPKENYVTFTQFELLTTDINVDLSGLKSFEKLALLSLFLKKHGQLILDGISEFANEGDLQQELRLINQFDFDTLSYITFNPSFSGLGNPELDFLINLSENRQIKEITLDGIKTITSNLKNSLSNFSGKKLHLRGVEQLLESDVNVLGNLDIVFECVTHISTEIAKKISKLKRTEGLNFPCLKNVDVETARAMTEWPPCIVGIFNPVSDETLKILMEAVNFNELWLNYEMTAEQVSFIKKNAINKSIRFPFDITNNINEHAAGFIKDAVSEKNKEINLSLGKENIINLTYIPAGKFLMGPSDSNSYQTATISKSFYMSKNVVTQSDWEIIMKFNPSQIIGKNLPVVNVSWFDCQKFISKLNEKTKSNFRLPTEAEWEYACRAGTKTKWFFGDELLPEDANFDNGHIGTLSEVGRFKQNALGLYDMHGNVFEWCNDWYEEYSGCNLIDPQGPMDGKMKISRGGSFCSKIYTNSSSRHFNFPHYKSCTIGFRLVLNT